MPTGILIPRRLCRVVRIRVSPVCPRLSPNFPPEQTTMTTSRCAAWSDFHLHSGLTPTAAAQRWFQTEQQFGGGVKEKQLQKQSYQPVEPPEATDHKNEYH
jgi:hypothetical protein